MGSLPGWFDKKRGAAYGIVATGSSIGGVIFPIMIRRLIPEVGFGWSMRIGAFMILALLIIANATIKTRLPPSPKKLTKQILVAPFFELKAMLLFIGFMFMTFGIFIPINYVEVEALHQGMGPNLAQYLIPILNTARYASVDPSLRFLHIQAWSPFHCKSY
jgi:MFS transporter, MCT family, aspergillic acid transporter